MAGNGTLSAKQTAAIAALLDPAYSSVTAAAAAANVPLRTMHRWFGDEAFVTALRQAEGAALDAATMRLVSVVTPAVHSAVYHVHCQTGAAMPLTLEDFAAWLRTWQPSALPAELELQRETT